MYNQKLEGKIRNITAEAKQDGDTIIRRDTISLCFEFTKEFAAHLDGKDPKKLQEMLSRGSLSSAKVALSAAVKVTCSADDSLAVEGALKTLSLKRTNAEDPIPVATLTLAIPTEDKSHMWFVHHMLETVGVEIVKSQEDLPGVE